ncbi:MAG: phage minor head protein [Chloroflexota bacterium]|nr:phage minor head protein [Chloroflexota bacterium]
MSRTVIWDVWQAVSDKRTCARCGALHGKLFRRGEGPVPPLHDHCRCKRILSHIEIIEDSPPPVLPILPVIREEWKEEDDE